MGGQDWSRNDLMQLVLGAVGYGSIYMYGHGFVAMTNAITVAHGWLGMSGMVTLALVAALAASLAGWRGSTAHWADGADVAGATVMIGGLLLGLLVPLDNLAIAVPCLLGVGISYVWFMVRWWNCYARLATPVLVGAVCLGVGLSGVAKIVMALWPDAYGYLSCGTPILLCSALWLLKRETPLEPSAESAQQRPLFTGEVVKSLLPVGFSAGVFFFLWGCVNAGLKWTTGHYGYGATASPVLSFAIQALNLVLALVFAYWVFVRRRQIAYLALWRVVLVCFAIALAMLVWWGMHQGVQLFSSASFVVAFALTYIGCANIAHHSSYPPVRLFGILMALQYGGDWLGRWVASAWGPVLIDPNEAVLFLLVVVLLLAGPLSRQAVGDAFILSDLNGRAPQPATHELSERCQQMAQEYGLTAREQEIMAYMCRGRSCVYIAEALTLSENTVATYARRLYQKLGIHTKQELLDLVATE